MSTVNDMWSNANGIRTHVLSSSIPTRIRWLKCSVASCRGEVAAREHQQAFAGGNRLPADGFDVDSICLWLTREDDPTLQSWRLIKEFQLAS